MIANDSRFVKTLNQLPIDRPPIWLMRQAGRYLPEYRELRSQAGSFLDLCYSVDLAAEVTLQPIQRFQLDAAIMFSDILVIPDALGQPVAFKEGIGPVLEALTTDKDIAQLDLSRVTDYLVPVYEALSLVKSKLSEDIALIGFCGAPWTIATYMIEGGSSRDYVKTKRWAFGDRSSFQKLINILEESIFKHLVLQVKYGADVIQIFDSWAGLLPDGAFQEWCVSPIRRIVARVKEECPHVPIIIFPRLAGVRYREFVGCPGVDAVSLDQTMSREWARRELQPHLVVQGNLDPVYLVEGGNVLTDEVDKIYQAFNEYPFIFNLGHGVMQTTPPENVSALCDYVAGQQS